MVEAVERWQRRLEGHFVLLRERRPAGQAVFALEHGLDEAELRSMRDDMLAHARSDLAQSDGWLLWVAHAAEVAYSYAGEEFWPSFGNQTPGWHDSRRESIRDIFKRFARELGGPIPRGAWAEAFTIIAWPITNAILPSDLQRHVARVLYQARYGLASRMHDIEHLGTFLAGVSWEGSDRFRQLREQPMLLGQVAYALLRPTETGGTVLHRPTLERIARDLDRERAAARWLKSARSTVERSEFKFGRGRNPVVGVDSIEQRVRVAARITSPHLAIRPGAGESEWSVWLTLPNLASVADVDPTVRHALLSSRCMAPAADRPIARGRLLFDRQEIPLARWPQAGEPLLRFDGMAAGLEAALLAAWAMPDDPVHLFSVASEGRGRYVSGRVVRPGRAYVVASAGTVGALSAYEVASTCQGVHLYRIRVPEPLTEQVRSILRQAALLPTLSTAVWPVGDVPLEWDGEGLVTWSTVDHPMLGLIPDHDLLSLSFDLSNGSNERLRNVRGGRAVIVALGLAPGAHKLTLRERDTAGNDITRALQVNILEGRAEAAAEQGALRVWVEPYSSDLEDLWSGAVTVSIAGTHTSARVVLRLLRHAGGQETVSKAVDLKVPISGSEWRDVFVQHFARDSDVAAAYDGSRAAQIDIEAGVLGRHRLEFERTLPPMRWRVKQGRQMTVLSVDDDTDSGLPVRVYSASFLAPVQVVEHGVGATKIEVKSESAEGLWVARAGIYRASAIVPPTRAIRSLQDLQMTPQVDVPPRTPRAICELLARECDWARAPLPGHAVARYWRRAVLAEIQWAAVASVGGSQWVSNERRFVSTPTDGNNASLRRLLMNGPARTRSAVQAVLFEHAAMVGQPPGRLVGLLETLVQRVVADWTPRSRNFELHWLAEFYMRLATDPEVYGWAGRLTEDGLSVALTYPLPLCVARFMAIRSRPAQSDFEESEPSWSWL